MTSRIPEPRRPEATEPQTAPGTARVAVSPQPPASWRRVLLPAEHGGWAFLGEPVLLGLLVAFSGAGALVALAAIATYFARTPLRIFLGDRRHGRRYPRTAVAERAFAICVFAGAVALVAAVRLGRGPVLLAVGAAAPLAALALTFDLGRRSREMAAEVAAALALGASAPAIALASGWPAPAAFGLWGILAARAAPAVLYIRARLRLDRGEPAAAGPALAAHLAAVGLALLLVARGLAPWTGAAAIALLALRATYGLSRTRPRMSTARLGLTEVAFGLLTVAAIWAGVTLGA